MAIPAPPALGRESGVWQPIETAPCDDTDALVYWGDGLRTIENLDHDSDPAWWAERGATHWMPLPADPPASFQARVDEWMQHCFGAVIRGDKAERNHRFIEEALELVQAAGCTASEAHQLVDYVFGRPVGDMNQEVGGVVVTLAALCNAHGVDLDAAAETELRRVWTKSDQIRAKQAAKPKHSPLPA